MTDPNDEIRMLPALMNYRDTAAHAFVPPTVESIAAAGRRRRRRTGVIMATAAVAVGMTSAIVVAGLPRDGAPIAGGTPSPTATATSADPHSNGTPPSASPSAPLNTTPPATRTHVPVSAMLQPEDLGTGYKADDGKEQGDWHMEYFTGLCPDYQSRTYPGRPPAVQDRRERSLTGPERLVESVSLTDESEAAWQMNFTREWVGDCADFTRGGERYRMTIVASGFAGEESFLVRVNEFYWAYVREGPWAIQIGFRTSQTIAEMTGIAVKAADRLP